MPVVVVMKSTQYGVREGLFASRWPSLSHWLAWYSLLYAVLAEYLHPFEISDSPHRCGRVLVGRQLCLLNTSQGQAGHRESLGVLQFE
jgi:hypothetical protein